MASFYPYLRFHRGTYSAFNRITALLAFGLSGPSFAATSPLEPVFLVSPALYNEKGGPSLGLSPAEGTTTVTLYSASDKTDKFSNGIQLCAFGDWLYAQWQSCPKDEDTQDSRSMWTRTRDGLHWDEPKELARASTSDQLMRGTAGFWSTPDMLVAYIHAVDSWYPGKVKITEARVTRDGVTWSPLQEVTPIGSMSETTKALPSGRLLTVAQGHFPGSTLMYAYPIYSDQADGLGGWKIAKMTQPESLDPAQGAGVEPSWFLREDGHPIMIFRNKNNVPRLLASIGAKDGSTWSTPTEVTLPDSGSMQCAGNLPGGTAYIVNNPTTNRSRIPLAITLSQDGVMFDRAFLVRSDCPPRRYEGKFKTLGFNYPGSFVWRGHLYISYTTNKEDVQVTRIPIDALVTSVGKSKLSRPVSDSK